MSIMRTRQIFPAALRILRHLVGAARRVSRPDRHMRAWLGMALLALVTGILLQVLPSVTLFPPSRDVPSPTGAEMIHSPLVVVLRLRAFPVLNLPERHQASTGVTFMLPPAGSQILEECDLEDHDRSPLSGSAPENDLLQPSPLCGNVSEWTYADLWPIRYLVRPQRLTRL